MLEELLVPLVARGHSVDVYLAKGKQGPGYDYRGITVHRRGANWLDAAAQADVLITHLDQTSETIGVAAVLDTPIVQVLHNTMPPTKMWASCKADLLVFNSEHMAAEIGGDGIVVRPPVWAKDYRVDDPIGSAGFVTLVNASYRKGGLILAMLAAAMPGVDFLVVEGAYGEQLRSGLPNVRHLSHASTPMRDVYMNTAVLLMPSEYESWGRVGVEALASGIPVIASPTPGLLESLAEAGTFAEWNDLGAWTSHLSHLLTSPQAYTEASERASKRSAELDPTDDINRWILAVESL